MIALTWFAKFVSPSKFYCRFYLTRGSFQWPCNFTMESECLSDKSVAESTV